MTRNEQVSTLRSALQDVDADLVLAGKESVAVELHRILDELEARVVAVTDEKELIGYGVIGEVGKRSASALIPPPSGIVSETVRREWQARLAGADVGITCALGVAAETGTLLMQPLPRDQRAVSLLPTHHLVLLPSDRIVSDVAALFRLWQETGHTAGNAVFVTGPSRTADIEKELVLGVHGPQSLSLILVD